MFIVQITDCIEKALKKAVAAKAIPEFEPVEIGIFVPKRKEHGDFSSNIAILLGKKLTLEPSSVAKKIAGFMDFPPGFCENISTSPDGFINITLTREALLNSLFSVIEERENFGKIDIGKGEKVYIEPLDSTSSGFFSVEDGRKIILGDFLCSIMEFANYKVHIEPYMKDYGEYLKLLGISVEARYRELLGDDSPFPHEGYKNKYIVELAKEILENDGAVYLQATKLERTNVLKEKAYHNIIEHLKKSLKNTGIDIKTWISARHLLEKCELNTEIEETFKTKELIYDKDNAIWLKTSDFGDSHDRILYNQNKEASPFLLELRFIMHNIRKGIKKTIFLKRIDAALDFYLMMSCALKILGFNSDCFEVLPIEGVMIIDRKEQNTEITENGDTISFDELMKKVSPDIIRLFYFLKNINVTLDFDIPLAMEESNSNPFFYFQSAFHRLRSLYRLAEKEGFYPVNPELINIRSLSEDNEIDIAKKVIQFPSIISNTIANREPYNLIYYIADLINSFHNYYSTTKILNHNANSARARMLLMDAVGIVVYNAMNLLKIKIPEKV